MAEIKVGPQKKADDSVCVELIGAKRYVFGSKVYQRGFTYSVPRETASLLLDDETEHGAPFFRVVIDEAKLSAAIPPQPKAIVEARGRTTREPRKPRKSRARADADDQGIEIG